MRTLALLTLIVIISFAVIAHAQTTGAKLYIEETTFDYGYIPTKATVTHSYFMYNYGTDTLKILKVKPG